MAARTPSEDILENPVFEGSGNVFADLGLPDADELRIKAEMTRQIRSRVRALGLTHVRAAERLGLRQSDALKLIRGVSRDSPLLASFLS